MKKITKNKAITGIIVIATIVLAGVAVFTAVRLYQLRKDSVSLTSPESEPMAWDCSKYIFAVDASGNVTVRNDSTRSEPPQKADVYINGEKKATFDVPALSTGGSANLGKVDVSGSFTWRVVGTSDCQNSGQALQACQSLAFNISGPSVTLSPSVTPRPTVTVTPRPTNSVTPSPTGSPIGGPSTSPTITPNPSATLTPTTVPNATATLTPTSSPNSTAAPTPTNSPIGGTSPTPTAGLLAQANSPTPRAGTNAGTNDQLPAAGISLPTLAIIGLGIFLLIGAFMLAL